MDLSHGEVPLQHSLGLGWELCPDVFTIRVSSEEKPLTRRGILLTVNSIFDPLGFLSPVTLQGKVILRDMAIEKKGWDEPIPGGTQQLGEDWRSSLKHLNVPRCYIPGGLHGGKSLQLHVFSDALEVAIAVTVYIKAVDVSVEAHVGFVWGKSKVAPVHGHTIPRLELCAAVIAVELAELVTDELDMKAEDVRYYTDSRVVLGYLHNQQRRFYMYVTNRVARILKFSNPQPWSYVPTTENTADQGTRPLHTVQIADSVWLQGPKILATARRWSGRHVLSINRARIRQVSQDKCGGLQSKPTWHLLAWRR